MRSQPRAISVLILVLLFATLPLDSIVEPDVNVKVTLKQGKVVTLRD
jgi:hypothetical protein